MEKRLVMVFSEAIGKIMYGVFEDSEVEEILDENIVDIETQTYWATYILKAGIEKIPAGAFNEALEDFKEYLRKRTGFQEFQAISGIITGWRRFGEIEEFA